MTEQAIQPGRYSVVIAAYNAAGTLGEAVASLLAQSEPPARIVVVDDGSTDATAAVAAGLGVDLIRQANSGPGAACNAGIDTVATEYLAFIDADDLWLPHKAALQLAMLREEQAIDGVFGRGRLFRHGRDDPSTIASDTSAPMQDLWGRTTLMMRLSAARRIGPIFDPPRGRLGEIIDWISRGRHLGMRFDMIHEVVSLRRIIPGSLSYGHGERDMGYLDVARRAIERRRAAQMLDERPDRGDGVTRQEGGMQAELPGRPIVPGAGD